MRVRLAFVGAPYRVDGCGYRNRPHEIHFDSAMVSEPVSGLDGRVVNIHVNSCVGPI